MQARTTQPRFSTPLTAVATLMLALAGFACASLQYRQTVNRFEAAREVAMNPDATEAARTVALAEFGEVTRSFDDPHISAMERRRRPDALVMRAYSEWQIGLYDDAQVNARRAQVAKDVVPGSYADLTSRALSALVTTSHEVRRWNVNHREVKRREYRAYESNFADAMARLDEALGRQTPDTPAETAAFVRYARWRVASDWRWVVQWFIGKRKDQPTLVQRKAIQSMREVIAGDDSSAGLMQLVAAIRLEIPADSPLRRLADAEAKQPRER